MSLIPTLLIMTLVISSCLSAGEKVKTKGLVNPPTNKIDLMDTSWQEQAATMVERQIKARGVRDSRVMEVMRNTPRHLFVPPHVRGRAYEDRPLPIGAGQTISQPYIVARMTELLELSGDELVLEIGTGSGYQAAILAKLCDSLYTIEIVGELATRSQELLDSMEYHNVHVREADGYAGWPEAAPFDAIILTAAPPETPPALIKQLKPGGIMVLPEGTEMQRLIVIEKTRQGKLRERNEGWVRFVPMVHGNEE